MKNLLKKKLSPILALVMAFVLCFALVGCKDEEKTIQEEFAEYYNMEEYGKIDISDNFSVKLWRIEKAHDDRATYYWVDVSYDIEYNNGFERLYSWIKSANTQKRNDLKLIGDMFIAFAKAQNLNNNYDLIVTFSYFALLDTQVIYNYETEELHTPKVDGIFVEMFEQFGTCNYSDVMKMSGGKDWLVSKKLGDYKHGVYERDYNALDSMRIWCHDGEIHIYDQDKSNHF